MSLFKEKKSKVRITGNTIIINGKRISGDFKDCIKSHFDEKKVESAKNIDSITIVSDCFVKISTSNSSDIEVHFYGDAQIKGDVKFKVTKMGDELKITLKLDGMLQIADLNLEISIPKDKKLKKLFVETTSDDVVFTDSLIYSDCLKVITASGDTNIKGKFDFIGIESTSGDIIVETKSVDCLKLKKISGDVNLNGEFKNIDINLTQGNIVANIYAKSNVEIYVETVSADAEFVFHNVRSVYVTGNTNMGDICNNFKPKAEGYSASVSYSTIMGDITIN